MLRWPHIISSAEEVGVIRFFKMKNMCLSLYNRGAES